MQLRFRTGAVIVAVLAVVALGVLPSHADYSVTESYTIGTTPILSVVTAPDPDVRIGGWTFAAEGNAPISVAINDLSMGPVSFTVCQDFNGLLCGEAGEPRVDGCASSADLSTSVKAFEANRPTSVFIRVVGPTQPQGCTGLGLGGTITMTFAGTPA
jgi:hypothetical protein